MQLNKQYTFQDLTDIVAAEVNVNFDDIVAFINNQLVHTDGTKPFTSIPVGPSADPTSANQLARKAYVDARDLAHRAEVDAAVNNALTTANNAQNSANAANSNANGRLSAGSIKWGYHSGVTNGAGDTVIAHGLGRVPGSVQLTIVGSAGSLAWKPAVENIDAANINVRCYLDGGGGVLAGTGVLLYWLALG